MLCRLPLASSMEGEAAFQRGQPSLAPNHKPRRGALRGAQRGHLGRCHQATLRRVDGDWGVVQGRCPLRAEQHGPRTGRQRFAQNRPILWSRAHAQGILNEKGSLLQTCGVPTPSLAARTEAAVVAAPSALKASSAGPDPFQQSAGAAVHRVGSLSLRLYSKRLGSAILPPRPCQTTHMLHTLVARCSSIRCCTAARLTLLSSFPFPCQLWPYCQAATLGLGALLHDQLREVR